MSTDYEPEHRVVARVVPIRSTLRDGERMTALEALVWVLGKYVRRPLEAFSWRSRITPALRERCIDYAIRSGSTGSWNIRREADEIAQYIAGGKI